MIVTILNLKLLVTNTIIISILLLKNINLEILVNHYQISIITFVKSREHISKFLKLKNNFLL